MKLSILILSFILLFLSIPILADEGDTLVIQTIDWDTPTLPGWNNPRSGIYQFPGDSIAFSKILMYYTLKCDPGQSPACGEWDYTTHTNIHEHTGVYDSNLYYHPNYMVNNGTPDSFMFMNNESYKYQSWLQFSNQTDPSNEVVVGEGGEELILHQENDAPDGRMQHLYMASELISAGVQSGDLTGMKYLITGAGITFSHFKVRMKNTNRDTLLNDTFISDDFTTVLEQKMIFETGIMQIDFAFPFNWDGTSNILVDISYSDNNGSVSMEADEISTKKGKYAILDDYYLDFNGWDYINVPAEVFSTIDNNITISFWQYGNPQIQPANSSILEGLDSAGHRVLNVHLPWSNEIIYWDAGWNDGFDRLDLSAGDHSIYMGKWNHWTFTKNAQTGLMLVYLNGKLWNIGGGFYRPMSGIAEFRIGASVNTNTYYAGMIDDFTIYDDVVDSATIRKWMYKDITEDHPFYDNLRAYYQFNEGSGFDVEDSSPNGFNGTQFGFPAWKSYNGADRFKNASGLNLRPRLILQNGIYDPAALDSIVMVDTLTNAPVSIVLFNPDDPPSPIDTLTKWPAFYDNYVYNPSGVAVDSALVTPNGILYHEEMPYYGDPYEVINKWEIGRFITPYGNNLSLGDGWTWVYDVTDYAPMLRDSVHLTAGNFQELLDLKFYMIEGTPPRDVKKIEKIYSGYYYLNSLPENVAPDTIPLIDEASTFRIKTRTSGHLFDNETNCAEFCYKIHDVQVNGNIAHEWQIIEECSDNPLYPQGGTWIYDRAGWCPGAKVTEHDIEVTHYIIGESAVFDYNSEPDQYGSYVLEMQLFSYNEPNFNIDAAIDEVIAPNKDKIYKRFNPTASSPILVIQNRGRDTLKNVNIVYGPEGNSQTFSWTGSLPFMEKETITLDAPDWVGWTEGNGKFIVELKNPNDSEDENTINDIYKTEYLLPPVYPGTFVIHFRTNKMPEQNHYQIFDTNGEIVFEKGGFEAQTLYVDTVTLVNGIYDFYLWDSGDNGISFWANSEGSGSLKIYDLEDNLVKSFISDFGDRVYHSFFMDMYLGTNEGISNTLNFNILPNPSNGNFTISYAVKDKQPVMASVYNTSGQVVWSGQYEGDLNNNIQVNLERLPSGIYTCIMESTGKKLSKKFVIK